MPNESEITITCRQCGKEFTFNSSEQEFFKLKGFVLPQHCKACRVDRRTQTSQLCSSCGVEIPKGKPVYCSACLASVQLGYELDTRKIQSGLDESKAKLSSLETEKVQQVADLTSRINTLENEKTQLTNEAESRLKTETAAQEKLLQDAESRLKSAESERAQLNELVQQKEQAIKELEQRFKDTYSELEKSLQYRLRLEWLEPTLLEMKKRLETVEYIQNNLGNNLTQLVQWTEKERENNNLFETVKRFFRPNHRTTTLSE